MNKKEILDKLSSGDIKLYEIEKYSKDKSKAIEIRREYISNLTDSEIKSISEIKFNPDQVYGSNCENVIGDVSMPIGVAGPLKVNGMYAKGSFYAPIATTEGALVASINRGAKIIHDAGGVKTTTTYHGITRAPVFRTKGIQQSKELISFVNENIEDIKTITSRTDRFIKFKGVEPFINGRSVWLRFSFDTDQAMGMNMAVKATKAIAEYILKNNDVRLIALSGNLCIDKKPSSVNTILGRGRTVDVEVRIPGKVIKKYLRCEVDDVVEANFRKTWQGSVLAGSLGFNAHIANMIAGLFIATGQDPAHVVDASTGITTAEKDGDDLYFSVKIPTLNIATVGGGTVLNTQREMIEMMLKNIEDKDWQPENRVAAFSEIIGAVVLAGELSLHGAFAGNNFARAHQDLGRAKMM